MKKIIIIFIVFIFSCSVEKFEEDKNSEKLILSGFYYERIHGVTSVLLYLYEDLYIEEDGKYRQTFLENLPEESVKDYYWILDKDTIYNSRLQRQVNYGEHEVKLYIIDYFGDTLSDSGFVYIEEPFKITLLSPVNNFKANPNETLGFAYTIRGLKEGEMFDSKIYVSTNINTLWEEENIIFGNSFVFPNIDSLNTLYWGVKASTEFNSVKSEIRKIYKEELNILL